MNKRMMQSTLLVLGASVPLASGAAELPAPAARLTALVIKAAAVHDGQGNVYEPGAVVIQDGEIIAVGKDLGAPAGAQVLEFEHGVITPGLIDAACQLGVHRLVGFAEQSSEVIPHLDVADAIDLHSDSLEELAEGGVTTVFVTPEAASVIGSDGGYVKTGDLNTARVFEGPETVKATLARESWRRGGFNTQPFGTRVTFYARRPTTRMGSSWVFRKSFYDAMHYAETREAEDPLAMAELAEVLEGETKIRFQARKANDIYTAQRLADEFGIEHHTIEYGLEAFKCLPLLQEHRTPVIFGPLQVTSLGVSAFGDSVTPCLTTPQKLLEHEIPFCLTACDGTEERGLARMAGMAIRTGLEPAAALKAVTMSAAEILGIDDRVGSLSKGKHADVVVWNGEPFTDTSKPIFVVVDGKPAYDPDGTWGES